MNYKMMGRFISQILLLEATFMLPALSISLVCREGNAVYGFCVSIAVILAAFWVLRYLCRGSQKGFYARDGLVCVGLGWIVLSLMGCLPFYLSGEIPSFLDALFEIVSGFTTTGASILPEVESLSRGILYWRSFSHWLGGMGILVFLLAVVPAGERQSGFTMHILRAESPGPTVGKLVPRMRRTASEWGPSCAASSRGFRSQKFSAKSTTKPSGAACARACWSRLRPSSCRPSRA